MTCGACSCSGQPAHSAICHMHLPLCCIAAGSAADPTAPGHAASSTAADNTAGPTANSDSMDVEAAAVSSDAPEGGAISAASSSNTASQSLRGVRATTHHMVSTVQLLQPGVAAVWKRAFVVDMLVTVQVGTASSMHFAANISLL